MNNVVLGFEFNSKILPFSVFKFVQAISVFVILMIEAEITTRTGYLIYYGLMGLFAYFALSMMVVFKYKVKE